MVKGELNSLVFEILFYNYILFFARTLFSHPGLLEQAYLNAWTRLFLSSSYFIFSVELKVLSVALREYKTVLDSGLHAVDSGFVKLDFRLLVSGAGIRDTTSKNLPESGYP